MLDSFSCWAIKIDVVYVVFFSFVAMSDGWWHFRVDTDIGQTGGIPDAGCIGYIVRSRKRSQIFFSSQNADEEKSHQQPANENEP